MRVIVLYSTYSVLYCLLGRLGFSSKGIISTFLLPSPLYGGKNYKIGQNRLKLAE